MRRKDRDRERKKRSQLLSSKKRRERIGLDSSWHNIHLFLHSLPSSPLIKNDYKEMGLDGGKGRDGMAEKDVTFNSGFSSFL